MGEPTWADGPMLALDFEATGVDIETARIVTATAVRLGPTREPVVSSWLIAPDIDIPAEATAIHKITTEYAREHGRPAADVLREVRDAVLSAWAAKAIVVGHNVGGYDLSLLDRECRRWLDAPFAVVGPVADSLALDRAVDKYRKGSRKLEVTCEHYAVRLDGSHDAEFDAMASARIVWRICRQYREVGAMSPRELWRYQRAAYRTWAEGFQDYKRQQARDAGQSVAEIEAIVIPPDWPLRPLPAAIAADPEPTGART
jgi:DNA polymerase-3 subunit epsilon